MSTTAIRTRLDELEAEAAAAAAWGADGISAYADDLRREIEHYRSAYVGAAVTEIASLRARLSGPQLG
jgi:phage shock protein A